MPQKWKVLLAFTGIFVAGAVAGGIVALRISTEKAAEKILEAAPSPVAAKVVTVTPDTFPPQQLKRFTDQLTLTSDQSEKIQPILAATGEKLKQLSQDNKTATNTLLEDMDKQVSSVLTEAQRKKLSDIQKRRRDQFAAGNRRGGGPQNPFDRETSSLSSPFTPGGMPNPGGRRRGGGGGFNGPPGGMQSAPAAPAAPATPVTTPATPPPYDG